MPLQKFVIRQDGEEEGEDSNECADTEIDAKRAKTTDDAKPDVSSIPKIPAGLKQEYTFMPSRVRDAYLLTALRALMMHGGRSAVQNNKQKSSNKKWQRGRMTRTNRPSDADDDDDDESHKARSAIVFVATCERAALVSGILSHVGVENVALHSLLSQNRRLASLAKFKSQQVRVLVATDVASRGLGIPTVDLVINAQLPRHALTYVHRVGRTARAGRRGRAVSLVAESEVSLVHAAENASGRVLEKCWEVTDNMALELLGPVAKAARLTKMKLADIGFDELLQKFKERKVRDRKERERIEKALAKMEGRSS